MLNLKHICAFFAMSMTWTFAAETDSSAILFDDAAVREYTLTFYDNTWKATLTANWAADSGYVAAKFSDGTITLDSVGVRYKGNSSYSSIPASSPKKPLKIKFNEFRSGQTYYGVKMLNYSNGYGDPTFLREKIAYDISRKYLPTPRVNFANIRIGTDVIGLYTQVEQPDKSFLDRWFADATQNLFKAADAGASLVYETADPADYLDNFELKTNETENDFSGLIAFHNVLTNASDSQFCSTYPHFMDGGNVTKFLAFNMVLSHFDSYTGSGRNYYLYQQSKVGFMTLLPWDMNLAFGGYTNGWLVLTQNPLQVSNIASRPLMKKILGCEKLKHEYLYWIKDMIQGYANTDSVKKEMDRLAPIIRPFVELDPNKFYRIGAFDTNLVSNYRASASLMIPGLIDFSTARNANLLKIVGDSLPKDFVLDIRSVRRNSSLGVVHQNGVWLVQGLTGTGEYRADLFQMNGQLVQTRYHNASQGTWELQIPAGVFSLRITSAQTKNMFIIHNKSGAIQ